MAQSIVVVPCYDEEKRLDVSRFLALAKTPSLRLLFVDDGSKDGTLGVLRELEQEGDGAIDVLALGANGGKGEAVRQGMLVALGEGATKVGYADADLSTPPSEIVHLFEELERSPVSVVLGARVLLIGRHIERSPVRHVLGRAFAGLADSILKLPFYDTQCGAKCFRDSQLLRAVLQAPFTSRWAFDVELLGRLLVGTPEITGLSEKEIVEVPLREWIDVKGSKLHLGGMAKTLVDLGKIQIELARLRKRTR